jgi:hypothetical protein
MALRRAIGDEVVDVLPPHQVSIQNKRVVFDDATTKITLLTTENKNPRKSAREYTFSVEITPHANK